MLTGIHILLTYRCSYECDHCFVYSGPFAAGTFTITQVKELLRQASEIDSISTIYFEGGESFLFYPLMLESVRLAREGGFDVGIVTNSYWATSVADAHLWLKPLAKLEINDFSISNDDFHGDEEATKCAENAYKAARELGLPVGEIAIDPPEVKKESTTTVGKGEPVVGGGVVFRGRAVDKLTEDLPARNVQQFSECVREELRNPQRVHVDAYGNVSVCQGVSIGNIWQTPIKQLVGQYQPDKHPICGPLLAGGPLELARRYSVAVDHHCVDECHYCFLVRRALVERFSDILAPRQVYGLE